MWAPFGASWTAWARTFTALPEAARAVASRAVNGGHTATSAARSPSPRCARRRATCSRASTPVLFIFQFPAISGRRRLLMPWGGPRRRAGSCPPASRGRRRRRWRRGCSGRPARTGRPRRPSRRRRPPWSRRTSAIASATATGAVGERRDLERAHRPVPEDGARGDDRLAVRRPRCSARCRRPSSRPGCRRSGTTSRSASGVEAVGHQHVDRQLEGAVEAHRQLHELAGHRLAVGALVQGGRRPARPGRRGT